MKRHTIHQRLNSSLKGAGKLPAVLALVVLCLWPAWVRPCCCAAASIGAIASSPEQIQQCDVPDCCQARPVAQQTTPACPTDNVTGCVCCGPGTCPCETRVQTIELLTTTSTHSQQSVDQTELPITLIGAFLTWQILPFQVPQRFLQRPDSPGAIGLASDHCAVLCRWLN